MDGDRYGRERSHHHHPENRMDAGPSRLHHGCIILIKITFFLGNGIWHCLPTARNGDHHCKRKIHSTHNQELQGIVKHQVRTITVDYRENFVEFVFQIRRLMFSSRASILSAHSANSVDLTVMYDETVRMCSLPAWICVGTETGMHHCNGRFIILTLKISEECTKLSNQEHTFVYNGTAAHGNYVSIVVYSVQTHGRQCRAYGQRQGLFHIFRFLDEYCMMHGIHSLALCPRTSGNTGTVRHQEAPGLLFPQWSRTSSLPGHVWSHAVGKKLSYTIFSLAADLKALFLTDFFEEIYGDLEKDTNTIAVFSFCIFTAMLRFSTILKHLHSSIMCFFPFICNGSDTQLSCSNSGR